MNFDNLFVLDLANNHQGDLNHAKKIISDFSRAIKKFEIKATIKFQFRQLSSFIHPEHESLPINKHINRFQETELSLDDYKILFEFIKSKDLLTCCTPFDEESVKIIKEMDFDVVKIASCCAKDWPLIEEVAKMNKPVIFSTGGLKINNIDDLVSFFDHKGVEYAIMHCVSIYPTPIDKLNLNFIETLKKRYPNKVVGWSTHEHPSNVDIVKIAYAKGARMFERHIGQETREYKLNTYSSNIKDFENWLNSYSETVKICGSFDKTVIPTEEKQGINSLLRGVYVKEKIKKNDLLSHKNIFYSMPYLEGQLSSGNFRNGIKVIKTLDKNQPIMNDDIKKPREPEIKIIKNSIHEIKAMLHKSKIYLNSDFEVEYSHHYGYKNFRKTGAVIINCINRSYCKKLIVMLPGQSHPAHFHERKEETFQILSGDLDLYLDGNHKNLVNGDICLVQPGVWHSFSSKNGCIFEEISSTHYNNDSFYKDKKINEMKREDRKTIVENWGRFQI